MRRIVLLLAVILAGAAPQAAGQADARVEVTFDTASREPRVRILNLMEQPRWHEALDDAFRISLDWRVELWKRGGFLRLSTNVSTVEFTMVIRREPLLGQYFITYFIPGQPPDERPFRSFEEFVLNLERAVRFERLAPKTEGTWEYVVKLEVSALDEQQFAEMQRFLDASGRRGGGGALSNFLVRSLGLPSERLPDARSPSFRVP